MSEDARVLRKRLRELEKALAVARPYVKAAHHVDRCAVRYARGTCNCGKWDAEDALEIVGDHKPSSLRHEGAEGMRRRVVKLLDPERWPAAMKIIMRGLIEVIEQFPLDPEVQEHE